MKNKSIAVSYLYIILILMSGLVACNNKKAAQPSKITSFKEDLTRLTDSLQNSLPYSSFMGIVTDITYTSDTLHCTVYPNLFIGNVQDVQERKMYGKMLASEMLQLISKTMKIDKDLLKNSDLAFHIQYIKSQSGGNDKNIILSNAELLNSFDFSENSTLMSKDDYKSLLEANQKNLPTYINPNLKLNHIEMNGENIIMDCQLHGISVAGIDAGTIRREAKAKAKSITRQWAQQMKGMFKDFVTYKIVFIYNIYASNGTKLLDVAIPASEITTNEE